MKKLHYTLAFLVLCLALAFLCGKMIQAQANTSSSKIPELVNAMSRVRVYIEFYYMETGDYPESLTELEKDLNSLLPKNLEKVQIPKDPATGKDFIYKVSQDQKSYTLTFPDPKAYNMEEFQLASVPWGGFSLVVEERKNSFLKGICAENVKGLATACEYFIKDNKNPPKELKQLISKYVRTMPVCSASGNPYVFKSDGSDYTISCPNPEKHNMKKIIFSSKQGWITE